MLHRAALALALLALTGCGGGPQASSVPAPPPPPAVQTLDPAVKAELMAMARPFSTPVAGSGLEDLAFLSEWVRGVRLVGLGEATHGTREFFQMKHRVLEYLVTREGFRLFVIEASFDRCLQMLEYVQGERNDLVNVVGANGFWTWDTQEVADLLAWARKWNETHAPEDWVWCVGNDMQVLDQAVNRIVTQTQRVDATLGASMGERFKGILPYLSRPGQGNYQGLSLAAQDAIRNDLLSAQATLQTRQTDLKAVLGAQKAAILPRLVEVLLQAEGDYRGRASQRDPSMALNTEWWMAQRGPGTRAVLWAHNFHVATQVGAQGAEHRKSLGQAYFPMGFAFMEGGFQAITAGQLVVSQAPPMPAPSLEWGLNQLGLPRAILPLRNLGSTPGGLWLTQARPMRELGSVWFGTNQSHTMTLSPASRWDALIFFRKVEAARAL